MDTDVRKSVLIRVHPWFDCFSAIFVLFAVEQSESGNERQPVTPLLHDHHREFTDTRL
jgi:hypothetical protein